MEQVNLTEDEQREIDASEANDLADEQEFLDWFGDLDAAVPAKFEAPRCKQLGNTCSTT